MSIKILQITAAYKPAYIYGGPTMSVAKLCETLAKRNEQGLKSEEQGTKNNNQSSEYRVQGTASDQLQEKNCNQSVQSFHLCNQLQSEIFELEVFTTTANGQTELNVEPNKTTIVEGVKVTYFKRITKDHTHLSPILLWKLRKECINSRQKNSVKNSLSFGEGWGEANLIIHIHAWWNLVSILSCVVAKWYNFPVVISPRGMLTSYTITNRNPLVKRIIHKTIGERLLKYCHIHVTSEKEKCDVLSIINPQSITVILNLVDLGNEQKQLTSQQLQSSTLPCLSTNETTKNGQRKTDNKLRPFKLMFLSRIEEKKGLELLFKALSLLPFDWNLTIAGTGEENYIKSLKTKAERLKIDDRLNWIGQVTNEDKFILLAKHDLTVLTSYNENFANVVIESLSVGTPVLLSKEVGLADYIKEKKMGWITDLTPENIKLNLINAFESDNLREQIRETAPQIIIKDFDSENLIEQYLTLYSQIT